MAGEALPSAALPLAPVRTRPGLQDELLLVTLVAFVFAVHALASLAVPPQGIWVTRTEDGFLLHLLLALSGLPLVFVPVMLVQATVTWEANALPATEAIACWLAAVAATAVVATSFRDVPAWRRAFYGYLVAALLVQFAAVQWSTLGN